jgi:hypothetical protein
MIRRVSFTLAHTLVLSLVLCVLQPSALAQPNVQGQWTTVSNTMPINPIHVALLSNGKLLVVAGSGNCPPSQTWAGCPAGPPYGPSNGSGALLWDPVSEQAVSQFSLTWDMFCNGMVLLPDGRPFIAGGTIQYDPFYGSPQAATFDPAVNTFSNTPNMAHGRWYPTLLTLGDGRVIVFSGINEVGDNTNNALEYYSVSSGWSTEYTAPFYSDTYPRLHLLPNGTVFYSGSQTTSKLLDPSTNTWNTGVANTNYGGMRTYGTSVLLELSPSNNYDPQVMIMGGGNPSTNTTEIIDMGAATPTWQYGPNMSQPRIEMNAVVLPNGKVLAVGGSLNDEDTSTASLNADLYDPVSNTFSSAGANAFPRLYHSVALLLPDATVWLAGGNPSRGSFEPHIEIYQPAYLFNADGTMATRPSITSAPSSVGYGEVFTVATPDAASISSAVLVRNGTVTHAFGMDQRVVGLSFTVGNGILNVTAPPNGNIAPPGYYMLFVLNQSGVPSLASFVEVSSAPSADFAIAATPSSQAISPGASTSYTASVTPSGGFNGNVSFSVSGLPSGATASFSPTTVAGSGSSTMTVNTSSSTPNGTYTLTISANGGGLTQTTQVTLVVSGFSVAATPSSQTISPGGSTSYTASVTSSGGFNGNVSFSVSGLPSGATASFSPTTVASSGSSTMTVNTSNSTPSGTYTLTISANGGGLTQTTQVTLVVSGFSVTATPSSQTISSGTSTTYTVNVTPSNGFNSNVSFSVSGLPSGASASFSPTTVAGSGSSTMTVNTSSSTPSGAYTLTISANGGGLTQTTQVTLVVAGFSVAATPSSQTVSPGTSTNYTVNVTPSNGFTSNVSFSVSGLPSGATASFNPISVPGSGSSTMTVTTSSSTPGGTYTLTISATGSGLTHTTQVKLLVSGFSVAVTPSSQTVSPGTSTNYTVNVTPSNGFNSNVSFSVSGLPSGATASFNPSSVPGSGSSTMTVNTSSSTPGGTYTLTISATGSGLTHTTQVKLLVSGFSVAATPSSRTASPGTTKSYTVKVTASNGFTGAVSFSVSGLPSGATASFSPTTVAGSGSSTMTVNTSSSTPIGTYTLTISAIGSGLTQTTQVTLLVADFSISVSPSSQSVSTNSSTSYTVSVSALGSFTSTVTLRVSGLPAHVSGSFSPGSVSGSGTSTLTVSATTSLTAGTYTLTITGTGGGVTHSANTTLVVH